MSDNFYKAGPAGITDGFTHHVEPEVFPGTDALDALFEATGGKDGDRVLFEKASKKDYDAYRESLALGPDAPADVVGSLPTGEDSLTDSQRDGEGNPLVNPDAKPAKAAAKSE